MVGQPAKVGRGLRSIAINISKLAQENEYFEAANGKVKVALQNSNGEMRSTYDIMNDLGKVWDNLNETEQTAIATTLAGKTQFEVFANVMKNWGSAVEATNKATNSQGSSLRENAKYLDSIEGHLQSFNSAWEKLSYHLIDSSTIKGIIDIGTDIINIIDEIILALDQLPGKLGAIVGIAGVLATILGAKKLWSMAEGFLGITKAATETAEAVEGIATAASSAKGLSGLVGSLGSLGSALLPLVPALIALGGAFIYANHQYKNSFKGKTEEYKKLGDEITSLQSEIEALEGKEGELTSEEQSRLSILKMQLQVLQQQEALKSKQLTHAFDKDAKEKMHGKTHMEQGEKITEREDTVGEKYLKAAEKRFELQKKIKHLEDESRMHPLTEEQTKDLEKYNKELDKVYDNEYDALDKLIEAEEELANVDYSKLSSDGKAWYDNTHSAYLQALSDVESVRDAVGQAIETFGSAQFDAWDIDISSLKSADELTAKIKEKIDAMGEDEELTFRVKTDDGSFKEITKKKSELTEEDIDAIVNFSQNGLEGIESEANNTARTRDSIVHVAQEGAQAVSKVIQDASKDQDTTVYVKQSGAGNVRSTIDALTKPVTTIVNIVKNVTTKQSAKGKRKGEQGGLSWLGDEGSAQNPKPELVVGENGAYLAGTGGWELYNLKSSDTVYTASQTKKLLDGSQIFSGSVGELPRFKKGKKAKKKATAATNANVAKAQAKVKNAKSKKAKKKAKKNLEKLKKKRDKTRSAFDKELEQLKHKAKVNHWTDAKYQSEYQKLYNKYEAYLSGDQSDDYTEAREDYENEVVKADFDRRIGNIAMGQDSLASLISDINNSADLSTDEKTDAIADAYKASVEYNLKEYENGKKTRAKVVEDIQNYYKTRGKYDEDYYKMLEELREADQKKEVERLKELSKQQENKLSLAQKYLNKELDSIEKQIDAQKEEAEAQEKLIELQNNLNKAKSTSIRIYKEGVGFVYEQDTEAIKEAQKALDEYTSSQTKSELEQRADAIKEVLQLFEDLQDASDIHELELTLGVSSLSGLTGGNLGTNLSKWSDWIKGVIASQIAYSDLSEQIGNLSGADIDKWLGDVLSGGSHQISNTTLSEYLSKHSFANGILSAPGGLSRVGENLNGELVWLGKGDSVYSNRISKNLMQWGRYNPAQVLSSNNHSSQQVFNFDKIVLPNVRNAEDFYRELQKLPNMAIQQSTRR